MNLKPSMMSRWTEVASDTFSMPQGDLEIRSLVQQLRVGMDLVIYLVAWATRLMLVMLPGPLGGMVLGPSTVDRTSAGAPAWKGKECMPVLISRAQSESAIGRALFQVLALVNDIPASSRKYEFARALAERIVEENRVHGDDMTLATQSALGAGFRRTVQMLETVLARNQGKSVCPPEWSPLWSWISLPLCRLSLPAGVTALGSWMVSLLHTSVAAIASPKAGQPASGDEDLPEKLSQELLWISEKMVECGAVADATAQWASAGLLASLSMSAPAKVQRSLVKLCALLLKELVECDEVAEDAKIKVLVLWLPLLCNATHGGDGPIFSSLEKASNQKVLEQLIKLLPDMDQEAVLSIWLQEFAFSASDWPDLEPCYTGWCRVARNQAHLPQLEGHFSSSGKAKQSLPQGPTVQ